MTIMLSFEDRDVNILKEKMFWKKKTQVQGSGNREESGRRAEYIVGLPGGTWEPLSHPGSVLTFSNNLKKIIKPPLPSDMGWGWGWGTKQYLPTS